MRFKVKNSNIFPVPGNKHMLHIGTISYGLREFIVMLCVKGEKSGQMFIEEVVLEQIDFSQDVYASCKFINDDALAQDLAHFAQLVGLTDMKDIANTLFDRGKDGWLMGDFS